MTGRRVFVVEDEYFIADYCAQRVRAARFDVAGPFGRIDEDLLARLDGIDGALLVRASEHAKAAKASIRQWC